MPKNTVLVDVDGVLLDFVTPVLNYANARSAAPPRTVEDITRFNFFDLWPPAIERSIQTHLLADAVTWAAQRPYANALRGIQDLRSMGYDIVACTSPWLGVWVDADDKLHYSDPGTPGAVMYRPDNWDSIRRDLLQEYFAIDPSHVLSCKLKYLVRGTALVDDKWEHIDTWAQANPSGTGVLLDHPWNRSLVKQPNAVRADGWQDVVRALAR